MANDGSDDSLERELEELLRSRSRSPPRPLSTSRWRERLAEVRASSVDDTDEDVMGSDSSEPTHITSTDFQIVNGLLDNVGILLEQLGASLDHFAEFSSDETEIVREKIATIMKKSEALGKAAGFRSQRRKTALEAPG